MPAATLITSLPTFVTPEEHRNIVASTPSSFNDIPPKLCHKEDNVSVTLDPPLDNFSHQDETNGSLYVIESFLVYMAPSGRGFQIPYPAITLHAVSRADSGPSIYCQLDDSVDSTENTPAGNEDDAIDMRELNIVPQNASSLEPIFEALSICAALHPDTNLSEDEEMDDGNAFFSADPAGFEVFTGGEGEELSEVGRAALEHLESIIVYPPGMEPKENGAKMNGHEGDGDSLGSES